MSSGATHVACAMTNASTPFEARNAAFCSTDMPSRVGSAMNLQALDTLMSLSSSLRAAAGTAATFCSYVCVVLRGSKTSCSTDSGAGEAGAATAGAVLIPSSHSESSVQYPHSKPAGGGPNWSWAETAARLAVRATVCGRPCESSAAVGRAPASMLIVTRAKRQERCTI